MKKLCFIAGFLAAVIFFSCFDKSDGSDWKIKVILGAHTGYSDSYKDPEILEHSEYNIVFKYKGTTHNYSGPIWILKR